MLNRDADAKNRHSKVLKCHQGSQAQSSSIEKTSGIAKSAYKEKPERNNHWGKNK